MTDHNPLSSETSQDRALTEEDCLSCGACCSYSRSWPRFTLEDDADLALIPPFYVDESGGGMRCIGDRCSALVGEVGVETSCEIYALRPDVCRACQPGDDACLMARKHAARSIHLPTTFGNIA
jgi:Fe-S-cluster containining protein